MRTRTRATTALSTALAAGVTLAGPAATAPPSHADPVSCDTAYPVGDLTRGQELVGLTTTSGTVPGLFTGSVIGVLHDGIAPGTDLVMARLSSSEIQDSGIWEGMSGSPVYDQATHQLIGAVAYTLSWGKTDVAGITPWSAMQRYAGAAPATIRVPASAARTIARETPVSATEAARGFREVATPRLLSGLSQRALDRADASSHAQRFLADGAVSATGRALADEVTPGDLTAGGNLAATLSTGDILQAGLGTVTSVCHDRVVGFGHPMDLTGDAAYGMAGADTLYIQGDPLGASYKVANLGGVLGTIDQDRLTGISGPLGTTPDSIPISTSLRYTSEDGTTTTHRGSSRVQLPEAAAETAYYQQIADHLAAVQAYQGGTEHQTWSVTGHDPSSGPFRFSGGNVYTDAHDLADASSYDLPDLVWLLSHVPGVSVDGIDLHSTVTDDTETLKVVGMEQHRDGRWVTLGQDRPARVKAGHRLTLRLVFTHHPTPDGLLEESWGKSFTVSVPKGAAGLQGKVFATPTARYPFERSFPHHLDGVRQLVDSAQRSDQAEITLLASGRGRGLERVRPTPAQGQVIHGSSPHYRVIIG